ncbi:sulfurtransferase TusA family protein [Psychrobium sp. 1_MG-2023]|uniref:sulfurtransferase TusA family protein n=1 Tax=Psychrobium sp. 1_MG-2023 TaxID=3062624 RepID=UPI000C3309B3|nr:sulfurtransferase TusA family protein [Psychrobium sp. 1_MG-2023]MDP2560292.1 sulfurtransferase TusA family protein [Psychrobium sp. 1_MG-2023]PKF55409.1 response regulator SirA [Alteromonadales bacterium alter-6D02]
MITLDFTAFRCPVPLVQTKLYLKQAKARDSFEILLCDPGSVVDVPKLLKKLGHQVVLSEITDDNVSKYQVIIKD